MSEPTKQTIYAPGIAREVPTKYGPILKLSLPVDDFVRFAEDNQTHSGWINLQIVKRREPSDKATHSIKLDQWKPKQDGQPPEPTASKADGVPADNDQDVPF